MIASISLALNALFNNSCVALPHIDPAAKYTALVDDHFFIHSHNLRQGTSLFDARGSRLSEGLSEQRQLTLALRGHLSHRVFGVDVFCCVPSG